MSHFTAFLDLVMNDAPHVQPESVVHDGEGQVPDPNANGQGADTGNTELDLEESCMLLAFAESCMDYHGIEGSIHNEVHRYARLDPVYHDVEMYVVLLETLRARSGTNTVAHNFVHSQTFLTHVVNHLKMVLLMPHTMFYVTWLQEYVLEEMQLHLQAWKIPPEIIANNDLWETFAQLVQLFKVYKKGLDINQTLFKLAPKQAVISKSHHLHWAWNALSNDDFNKACEDGQYEKTQFWDYLEAQVAAAKTAIAENPHFDTAAVHSEKFS
ncbi:hypothetical protein FRC11_011103, partial [Ceratobasidium sp. 423]